jgi:hypothetical protein
MPDRSRQDATSGIQGIRLPSARWQSYQTGTPHPAGRSDHHLGARRWRRGSGNRPHAGRGVGAAAGSIRGRDHHAQAAAATTTTAARAARARTPRRPGSETACHT